jgi:hypothetical protein
MTTIACPYRELKRIDTIEREREYKTHNLRRIIGKLSDLLISRLSNRDWQLMVTNGIRECFQEVFFLRCTILFESGLAA